MRSRISVRVLILISGLVCVSNIAAASMNPINAYGPEIVFDVLRNGKAVGEHRVSFAPTEEGVSVNSRLRIDIKFLGLTVYKYRYESISQWGGGRLIALNTSVDDDGKKHNVSVKLRNGRLLLTGPSGDMLAPLNAYPTNHWNVDVLRSDHVINTITGKLNQVMIDRVGNAIVPTNTGPRDATHYRYSGDLEAEAWYDRSGRWVRLRFGAKDGSVVEYVCKRCGQVYRTAK